VNRRPSGNPEVEARSPRRNTGGARREASERVRLSAPGFETSGWTLNVSRGGVRAVVEEALKIGAEYDFWMGDDETQHRVSVVWAQDESDGQIVGLKYLDGEGSVPPLTSEE
jgi:hypothetical protein